MDNPLFEFCNRYNIDADFLTFQLGMGGNTFSTSYTPNWQNTTVYDISKSDYAPAWQNKSIHTTYSPGMHINSSYTAGSNQNGDGINQSQIGGYNFDLTYNAWLNQPDKLSQSTIASGKQKSNTTDKTEKENSSSELTVNENTVTMNGFTASIDKNGYITYKNNDNKIVTVQEIINSNCSTLVDKANEIAKSRKTKS